MSRIERSRRLLGVALCLLPAAAFAQTPPPLPPPQVQAPVAAAPGAADVSPANVADTQRRLRLVLEAYPPALRNVLQIDPSLLSRPDYLAPYPLLQAFLEQHPEVLRDPAFFFGRPGYDDGPDPVEIVAGVLAGIGVFVGIMTVLFIGWSLLRQVIDYRRWLRQSRVQTEIHTRILDRLQSNEDLLAYVQTPAGRHFLEFTPISAAGDPKPVSAPLGRILWSAQLGVVLLTLGIGLGLVQRNVPPEIVPAFWVLSVVSGALGMGGLISAAASYILSARLGLLHPRKEAVS
jgi:hypothetical protein